MSYFESITCEEYKACTYAAVFFPNNDTIFPPQLGVIFLRMLAYLVTVVPYAVFETCTFISISIPGLLSKLSTTNVSP